jgi:hypothetical protein
MNAINDDDDLLLEVDTEDEDLALDVIRDETTKESFMSLIDGASKGEDLLRIIELLPNSSQRYGHSLTMNAVMKIISRHATYKDRCTSFYTMKKSGGRETCVINI